MVVKEVRGEGSCRMCCGGGGEIRCQGGGAWLAMRRAVLTPDPPCPLCPPGAPLSQLSDSGQTLSEDSGVDIAESGRLSKESSPRPARTRPQADPPGGGPPTKPVRWTQQEGEGAQREREMEGWRDGEMDGWMDVRKGWM